MKRLRCDKGATVVEFAVSSTILFLFLFGIFAFSIALYSYNFVSNMAREGSRYAMVRGTSCVGLSDCNITSAQLQTYVRSFQYPGIDTSKLTATRTFSGAGAWHYRFSDRGIHVYTLDIPLWPQTGRVLNMRHITEGDFTIERSALPNVLNITIVVAMFKSFAGLKASASAEPRVKILRPVTLR